MAKTGAISGINGNFTFAGGYSAKTTAWTVNLTMAVIDNTALGAKWRTKYGGLGDWTGSATCIIDSSSFKTDSVPAAIGIRDGNGAAATFIYDDDGDTKSYISGTILVSSASIAVAVGDSATSLSYDFEGTGTPTINNA